MGKQSNKILLAIGDVVFHANEAYMVVYCLFMQYIQYCAFKSVLNTDNLMF